MASARTQLKQKMEQEPEQDIAPLVFTVISNDQSNENLETLTKIKNIFRKQLPKMPGEYIVRLVFDRNHLSMVAKREGRVIGGCCFRCFEGQMFAEIAFLAISYNEQVKGFGTYLMNNLKNWVMEHKKVFYFLTYADNFALGFFRKQGFTTDVGMYLGEAVWKGYIKDYDGGTLMLCKFDADIDYLNVANHMSNELVTLNADIDTISPHMIHRALDMEAIEEHEIIPTDLIPGLREIDYNSDDDE
jgi:histone acetyltransferase